LNPRPTNPTYRGRIGTVVPNSAFAGFKPGRVLIRYDRPLLQVMVSPRGESWLFNWLESYEDLEPEEPTSEEFEQTWVAFRVSESRLSDLEKDRVGLRDTVLAAEHQVYLVTGLDPLHPEQVRAVPVGKLPTAGLPRPGLTIHGRDSTKSLGPVPLPSKVDLNFRLSAEEITKGQLPFSISGLFQDRFQRWASAAAHFAFDPSPRAVELTYPAGDWASIRESASGTGSFRIEAVAQGEPFELDRLDEVLTFLQQLVDSRTASVPEDDLARGIGRSGAFALLSLLHFVMLSKVSVDLLWSFGSSEGSIKLDQRVARSIAARLRKGQAKIESNARLSIPLTGDEAAKIRLPVAGVGGLQDLLRGLQKQLDKNDVLSVTPSQIERILRYSQSYGSGGFQGRLQGVLVELKRLGASLSTLR
jgi:hypothetical protein